MRLVESAENTWLPIECAVITLCGFTAMALLVPDVRQMEYRLGHESVQQSFTMYYAHVWSILQVHTEKSSLILQGVYIYTNVYIPALILVKAPDTKPSLSSPNTPYGLHKQVFSNTVYSNTKYHLLEGNF